MPQQAVADGVSARPDAERAGRDHDEREVSPVISIQGVSRVFAGRRKNEQDFTAIEDVSLDIAPGSVVCLVGPSGCGKSTLLNMVAGLLQPTAGRIVYDGEPVTSVNTRAGYITQRDNLLPWATVEHNTALALELRKVSRAERRRRAREMLELVGLSEFAGRYPAELSGGMRKRVALARTFIYEPATLLMDEPFGALDAQMKLRLQSALLRLREHNRQTVLFVTHDLEEAVAIGDRVVVMGTKPGRIAFDVTIDLPRPRQVMALRAEPAFASIVAGLWRHLAEVTDDEGAIDGD